MIFNTKSHNLSNFFKEINHQKIFNPFNFHQNHEAQQQQQRHQIIIIKSRKAIQQEGNSCKNRSKRKRVLRGRKIIWFINLLRLFARLIHNLITQFFCQHFPNLYNLHRSLISFKGLSIDNFLSRCNS